VPRGKAQGAADPQVQEAKRAHEAVLPTEAGIEVSYEFQPDPAKLSWFHQYRAEIYSPNSTGSFVCYKT
jgi:hypothetical protein